MRQKLQIVNDLDDDFSIDTSMKRDDEMKANKAIIEEQFEYLGRMVNKKHFRAYVYSKDSEKLANSYAEYESLVSSGLWYASKEEALKPKVSRKERFKQKIAEAIEEPTEFNDEVIEYGTDR